MEMDVWGKVEALLGEDGEVGWRGGHHTKEAGGYWG